MKKLFTKMYWALLLLTVCAAGTARAQDTKLVEANNEGATAMCRDASGNVFVLRDASAFSESGALTANGAVDEYNSSGTMIGTIITNAGEYRDATEGDPSLALGIAVDASDNIYVTTYNDFENSIPGNIVKFFSSSGYTTQVTLFSGSNGTVGYGYFGSLAVDLKGNLYAFAVNAPTGVGTNVLIKIPGASSASNTIAQGSAVLIDGTTFANNENNAFNNTTFVNDNGDYAPFTALAIDKNNNIFIASTWGYYGPGGHFVGYDGGNLYEYTPATTTSGYSTANLLKSSVYCSSLGCDPNGDVFGTVVTNPGSDIHTFNIVNWGIGAAGTVQSISSGTTIKFEDLFPSGLAAVSGTNVFMINGNDGGTNDGDVYELTGAPASQASGFSTTSITETGATFSWTTNGGGANRAVFVALSTASPLSVTNSTTYAPSTTFTSGTPASTGWYCVYNSTTSSLPLNITGLAAAKTYNVMVVEYNGGAGPPAYQNYESGATVTTFSTPANPSLTASGGTDSYSVGGAAATVDVGITATAGQTNLNTATIDVSGAYSSGDALNFTNQNGITGSYNTGNGTLTLSGSATVANYQTALRSITFSSTSSSTSTRTISFTVGDGTVTSAAVTKNITVTSSTTISSLTAVSSTTTNAASVQYTATFAATVSGLSTADFTLNTTGVSGASVSGVSGSGTSWTVTVNTGSGNGTVQLAMNSSSGVTPSISNATAGSPFAGATYNIDKTAPTVSSINATSPSNATTTNASSVTYTVTFSESVTGVDATDFALTTSGTSGTVSGVSGSGTTYTVTVSGITGTGTLRLDLNSTGTGITDLAGNAINGGFTSGSVYTIDRTAPTVSSIALADGNPTNATTVDYTVTFSEPVTGVTAGAFSLVITSGNAAGAINSVTAVSTSVYTVNVTSVSGNGGLRLDLTNVSGISDLNSNQLASGFTGSVYTIDNTPATLTSGSYFSNNGFSSQYAKVGNQLTLSVGYSEQLQSATMTIGGNSVPVSFSNGNQNFTGVYTMTSSDVEGNVGWTLSATDLAGNIRNYTNNDFGTVLIFDKTPPAISISAPSQATANAAGTVNYTVTYSDANFNFSTLGAGDITLNTTGTANATVGLSGSGTSYTVTISNITGEGTIGFSIGANTAQDIPGNLALASSASGTFMIDNIAPTVSSITATTPSNANPTNATSLAYTVTFSEAVTGVSGAAFTGNNLTGTVSYSNITVSPVSSTVYTVTINGLSGDGTMRLDFTNGGSVVQDAAGNAATGYTGGDVYTIDNTPPTALTLVYSSSNTNSQLVAKVGDVITVDFTASETIQTPTLKIAGHSVTAVNTTGNEWVGSYTMTSGDTEGRIPFLLSFLDLANNAQPGNGYSDAAAGDDIEFDMTAPTVAISAPSAASIGTGTAGTVTYTVTYADANFNTSNLTTGGITLNTSGTANGTAVVSGSGASYTVTISSITGLGTLSISVGAGFSSDLAGNTDAGAGPSTQFNVLSTDATLSALSLSHGTLNPAFDPGTTAYMANEFNGTQSITVTPATNDPDATILIDGSIAATSGAATPVSLAVGANTITIAVTAPDGVTTKTYTVTVTRAPSSNDDLSGLGMDHGILTPGFTKGNTSYTASVGNAVTSIAVKAALTDPAAVLKVNGKPVADHVFSQEIPLNVGSNTIHVTIKAQDSVSVKTYTITVTRAPSANDKLASLKVSNGIFGPAFTPTNLSYTDAIGNTISTVTVTATTADPAATITVNGTTVTSGTASPVNVPFGSSAINVKVTAQDGSTSQTYTVTLTRPANSNADLFSLRVSMGRFSWPFDRNVLSYADTVSNDKMTIKLTPTTLDTGARVTVNGTPVISGTESTPVALAFGNNPITVIVTAEDGTTKTYTVTVLRPVYRSDNLAILTLSKGAISPKLDTAITSYTANVPNSSSSITVTPTVANPTATVQVNGTTVTSGTASGPINLAVGPNPIYVAVTAQDGTTTKTDTVTVTRAPSANANLASLKMSKGIFSPAFATATTSYTDAVGNTISSVTVTPTTADPTATVQVNGTPVTSGTASGPINLAVGANAVYVAVTAQDGTTTQTDTVTVTRAPGSADSYNQGISVTKPTGVGVQNFEPLTSDDGIQVHQGISPNGDGINDFLLIDNISQYPQNKLSIMNRNGQLVFEATGYDNSSKVFDGHSNKNGQMQLPGTYFYQLDYTLNGISKHKTGFIILKY